MIDFVSDLKKFLAGHTSTIASLCQQVFAARACPRLPAVRKDYVELELLLSERLYALIGLVPR